MKSIKLDNLIIEVTRRCNLTCAHCLRGSQQRMNIKKEYIEQLLSNVCYIYNITFTGGEPTLYLKGIEDTLDIIEKKSITVDCFYIATNGCFSRKARTKLMSLIVRMHEMAANWEENGLNKVRVDLSNEMYHYEEIIEKELCNLLDDNVKFLSILKCFDNKYSKNGISMKLNDVTYYRQFSLINEGRAVKLNTKCEKQNRDEQVDPSDMEIYDDSMLVSDITYLSANGNVVFDCDYSFKHADGISKCTAATFKEFIYKYAEEYEKSSN